MTSADDPDTWSDAEDHVPAPADVPADVDAAIAQITARAEPGKDAEMAAYHKVSRRYLGTAVPMLDALARDWRAGMELDARLALAGALWQSDIHEARVAAAKLLIQARIRPDDSAAWALICAWVPQFDAWAIADHVAIAGQKRLMADPGRLDTIATWTQSPHMWSRRAALTFTLPLTRLNHPSPAEQAARARVLTWAADYVADPDWFIQKAVAWWLRDLSRHDADATRAFLDAHGARMKPFARKEAARHLA